MRQLSEILLKIYQLPLGMSLVVGWVCTTMKMTQLSRNIVLLWSEVSARVAQRLDRNYNFKVTDRLSHKVLESRVSHLANVSSRYFDSAN